MTAYAQELRRCQVVLLLRAAIDAGGNLSAAAKKIGVHRNMISRVLSGAGYNSKRIRQHTRIHNLAFAQSIEERRSYASNKRTS